MKKYLIFLLVVISLITFACNSFSRKTVYLDNGQEWIFWHVAAIKDSIGTVHPNFEELLKEYRIHYRSQNDVLILIFNSVIHEIYSYGGIREAKYFKSLFNDAIFDYIVIRDMIPSENINRLSDDDDMNKVHYWVQNHVSITGKPFTDLLKEFEKFWGSIDNNKSLVHFLLKYRYDDNWQREVAENYFPMYRKDLLSLINPLQQEIVYQEHFILPYIKQTIQKDFDITLRDNTHFKIIIKNKR